jgi:hypothetical protein
LRSTDFYRKQLPEMHMELVGSRLSTLVRKVLLMSETLNLSFVHKIVTAETGIE